MKTVFERLARFQDRQGRILYGEAPANGNLLGGRVRLYDGNVPWELTPTNQTAEVAKILCPLPSTPVIYGIGLNYKAHMQEAGLPTPSYPTVFNKPADALNGPYEEILVHKECAHMDYEGELCVIIGKDCKNIRPEEDPLDYVIGYACGNDVSSRHWQMPPQSGQQHGYAKSFDGFAPIGPILVSPSVIPDVSVLEMVTRVNGEERQRTSIGDLLFSVQDCLRHLSRGRTLRKGTIIMTGTPSGVAAFMTPPRWLEDGDVVEVEISQIGTIRNKHVWYSEEEV